MRKIFDAFNLHTTQVSLFKDSQEYVVPKGGGDDRIQERMVYLTYHEVLSKTVTEL